MVWCGELTLAKHPSRTENINWKDLLSQGYEREKIAKELL
jgi:hypothetical protein